MKIEFDGIDRLARELQRLNSVRFDGICKKQLTEMLDRARNGGTPVDTGQLRNSSRSDGKNEMGYSVGYAPHVEYGHRLRGGGWVNGQHYLKKNVDEQSAIFREDLKDALLKG